MNILIQGWRFVAHSYAMVNCHQILELVKRPGVNVFFEERPFEHDPDHPVKPAHGMFPAGDEATLKALPPPDPGTAADVTFRITAQFDFSAAASRRTAVFAAAEWGKIAKRKRERLQFVDGRIPLAPGLRIITPSEWSKAGLARSGIDPRAISIVPHGVDTRIFAPAAGERRAELRRRFGWQERFVFLNNSLMTRNKGTVPLFLALSRVVRRHPQVLVAFKGRDDLLDWRTQLRLAAGIALPPAEAERIGRHLVLMGETLSFERVAALYQAADAYVSPYMAEAFNIPVLEAAACGLPVVCTGGGPTDDFTTADFALRIRSRPVDVPSVRGETLHGLEPSVEHLAELMTKLVEDGGSFAQRAREAGPRHVAANFTWRHAVDRLLEALA